MSRPRQSAAHAGSAAESAGAHGPAPLQATQERGHRGQRFQEISLATGRLISFRDMLRPVGRIMLGTVVTSVSPRGSRPERRTALAEQRSWFLA